MAYVLFPDTTLTSCEGCLETGYVTAPALAQLYGVSYDRCRVVYRDQPASMARHEAVRRPWDIELHPRADGKYPMAEVGS